jgi:hypothetical protein
MDHPVHRYRGYEILCSETGYTVIQGGAEVLNVGAQDATPALRDCDSVDDLLRHAEQAVDALIEQS